MDTVVPAAAQQDSTPGSAQDMAALEAETESLLPYKQAFVEMLMAVAAGKKKEGAALEELLAGIPKPLRPSARRRFFYEMDVIAEEMKKRAAAQRPRGTIIMGVMFNLAAAILLMAAGTYEKIRNLLLRRLDLEVQIKQLGATMLHCGVTPDMKMVEKLQRIVLQAQKDECDQHQEQ